MRSCSSSSSSSYLVHQEKKHFRATHSHGCHHHWTSTRLKQLGLGWFQTCIETKVQLQPTPVQENLIALLCFFYISHLAFVNKKPTNTKIKMSKTCRLETPLNDEGYGFWGNSPQCQLLVKNDCRVHFCPLYRQNSIWLDNNIGGYYLSFAAFQIIANWSQLVKYDKDETDDEVNWSQLVAKDQLHLKLDCNQRL